jgi:hypothetical protein
MRVAHLRRAYLQILQLQNSITPAHDDAQRSVELSSKKRRRDDRVASKEKPE